MKSILIIGILLAVTTAVMADHVIDESEKPQFLYVVSATSGSFDGETLVLTGVPSALYFSDRPYRVAGHMKLESFIKFWGESDGSFAGDPPNAALSILESEAINDIVIELTDALLVENGINFKIKVLKGSIPASFGSCSLFIDPPVQQQITDS